MKLQHLLFSASLLSLASISGCASLIGLQDRPGPSDDGGAGAPGSGGSDGTVIDKLTKIKTSPECVEYCDLLDENCAPPRNQYGSRTNCIDTCNVLPAGDVEASGNNLFCRVTQARAAANDADEFCPQAGPQGNGKCGSNCEAWCFLLEKACPEEYDVMEDCQQSCKGFDDIDNTLGSSQADAPNLDCRIYHTTASLFAPDVHCPHGRYVVTDVEGTNNHCFDLPEDLTCDNYCKRLMANCPETKDAATNAAVYDSVDDCLAACSALPAGDLDDRSGNTLGCHYYHANLAAFGRQPHCAHAGPSGEGACMQDKEEDGKLVASENCDSYCFLYEKGCGVQFAAEYGDHPTCVSECSAEWADRGAATGSVTAPGSEFNYVSKTATQADTLQCRIARSVKALAGDETACLKASLAAPCAE